MDWLVFWVAVGLMIEGTRTVLRKICIPLPEKDKGLTEPLVNSQEWVDSLTSGSCRLPCCVAKSEEGALVGQVDKNSNDRLEEERVAEIAGKAVEDEHILPTIVTGFDGRRWKVSEGKEIVEDPKVVESGHHSEHEETSRRGPVRPEIVPSRVRRDRREKSTVKIHPELFGLIQTSDDEFKMHSGKSTFKFGKACSSQSSGHPNDHKLPNLSGVPSQVAE